MMKVRSLCSRFVISVRSVQCSLLDARSEGGFMNPPVTLSERFEVAVGKKTVSTLQKSPERPTVLIATADAEMREALEGLLEASRVNAIWVSRVKDVKTLAAGERIVAC